MRLCRQGGFTGKVIAEAKVRLAGECNQIQPRLRTCMARCVLVTGFSFSQRAALSTNQSQKGVSFSGDALQHLYYATKFERRGLLLYSIFAQVSPRLRFFLFLFLLVIDASTNR